MYCTTLDDLGETAGPRIDRIQPARPPWWDRQFRELKKLFFSPPSKCPIDLFGPLANGRPLKRLQSRFGLHASVLLAASSARRARGATSSSLHYSLRARFPYYSTYSQRNGLNGEVLRVPLHQTPIDCIAAGKLQQHVAAADQ